MIPLFLLALACWSRPAVSMAQGASGEALFNAQVSSAAAQVQAAARDGWNFETAKGKDSYFFWEFKYFSFHGPEASGNIAFFSAAPQHSRQMIALAHLYTADQIQTYRKTFDLSCVRASTTSAELSLCDGGGIEVLAPDRYKIALRIGPAVWNLEVWGKESRGETVRAKLDGWLAWEMFWEPVFVRAAVSGNVEIAGAKAIELRDAPGYHDRNWGRWNPPKHPYRWLHFSGTDSKGMPVDVLLADFYKNKTEASVLDVQTAEGRRVYHRGEYEFAVLQKGRAPTTRFAFKEAGEIAIVQPIDPSFASGDHAIPIEFSVKAKDGSFSLTAAAVNDDASGPRIPILLKPIFKDFIIDEQVIRVRIDAKSVSGEERHAEGLGEFQTIGN